MTVGANNLGRRVADLAAAVRNSLTSVNGGGNPVNVVDGLFAIARALDRVAKAVENGRKGRR